MMRTALTALSVAMLCPAQSTWARSEPCSDLAPSLTAPEGTQRTLSGDDLVRLRDIGQPNAPGNTGPSAITLSPDGGRLAFQLRRADIRTNTYCLGMFVLNLKSRQLTRIDAGGELIRAGTRNFDFVDYPEGVPTLISPRWSPDGKWIAFLKRVAGRTQVWRGATDGSGSERMTDATDDVRDFAWLSNGAALAYATRPGLSAHTHAMRLEGLRGYHFDRRSRPSSGIVPLASGLNADNYRTIEIASGQMRVATKNEAATLSGSSSTGVPQGATAFARSSTGGVAWLTAADSKTFQIGPFNGALTVRMSDGQARECRWEACTGNMTGLWWSADGGELRYMRREGWANSQTALYRWRPGKGGPRKVFATDDIVASCQSTGDRLICLREASTIPREIVQIDPQYGKIDTLLRPNPEFTLFRLGTVERLRWRNDVGIETIGDLILPVDHKQGQKHPLIVVQYITRGFLRGGTGDEYPIQWFSANGYAVLSFQRPASYMGEAMPRDWAEANRAQTTDWTDRRSVNSALDTGIRMLIDRGVIDPRAIGITGMSDGASTASFAIVNSNWFAAASLSTCCVSQTSLMLSGEHTATAFANMGYPRFSDAGDAFWKPYALSLNPEKTPPLLLQLSSDEYLSAMATYTVLKEYGRQVDMFTFPDEPHVKWQPAHRSAIYKRNLAWFDFWLKSIDRDDLVTREELWRWKEMRDHR